MLLSTSTSIVLTSVFVLTYLYLFVYLPGHTLSKTFRLSRLDTLALSLVIGFSLYSLTAYTVRYFNLPFFVSELLLCLVLLPHLARPLRSRLTKPGNITKFIRSLYPTIRQFVIALKRNQVLVSIIFVTGLIQSAVLIRSGVPNSLGLTFSKLSFHDSIQHLTIITRLYTSSTIPQPGFAGSLLTNYHYLIDLSLAAITRFSLVSLLDTYYRIYPILISVSFSLTLFVFTRHITRSTLAAHLSIPIAVFGGNASFFVQFFRGPEFSWGANTFFINPLVDILQNPASIFVLAQLLAVIYLTSLIPKSLSAPNGHLTLSLGIIAGTMIGFKAWGGLLILAGLLLTSVINAVFTRKTHLFPAFFLSLIISLFLFLPHYQPATSSGPVWAPGWTLRTMVNDADRWNYLQDIFKLDFYQLRNHPLHQLLLYSKWTIIYLAGNYWLRLIGLFAIISLVFKRRYYHPSHLLIVSVTLMSLILPLFFNQGRMAYDIEQFSPYALLLSSVFTAHPLANHFLSALKSPRWRIIISFSFILLLIPSNFKSIKSRVFSDTYTISSDLMSAYHQIRAQTPPDSVILVYPSHRNIATLEFAALTGRNTFYSGRTVSIIVGNDYQTRTQQLKDFFDHYSSSERKAYARNNHITHLFLLNEEIRGGSSIPDFAQPVFETKTASLFRLNYD